MARHQINQTLNSVGIVTIEAQDGVEALKKLRQLSSDEGDNGAGVDMIISDIEMPEMDGYTFTRELRNDPEFSDSYVLLHTSLNGAINEDKATTCGANDILTKFVADELIKAVIKGLS
ncbi:response regulator [Candidatus Reidiella endopervernicosa]|nr:response regulator [Candidatus Reidiella endopervernicosa]QKQ26948.1 response regulator [Candidatus Reidiella endopervernicosa]